MLKLDSFCYIYRDHLNKEAKQLRRFKTTMSSAEFFARAHRRFNLPYEGEEETNLISVVFLFEFQKAFCSQRGENEKHFQYNFQGISGKINDAFNEALKKSNAKVFSKKTQTTFNF